MQTDDDIPEWALARVRANSRRLEKWHNAFVTSLPENYPAPRAEQEWLAYMALRKWWPRRIIKRAVDTFTQEDRLLPGNLGEAGRPDVRSFMLYVGLLAEGAYARSLPPSGMLTLIAGADAARGRKTLESAQAGHQSVHGTGAQKAERWLAMVADFKAEIAEGNGPTTAADIVAEKHGVSSRTVRRAVKRLLQ